MRPYEVVEDQGEPGVWRAEAIGPDGECYVSVFSGPHAERRARCYADSMNALIAMAAG